MQTKGKAMKRSSSSAKRFINRNGHEVLNNGILVLRELNKRNASRTSVNVTESEKSRFHIYNSKRHFSPSINGGICTLINYSSLRKIYRWIFCVKIVRGKIFSSLGVSDENF